jgi:hypothetical protein
MNLGDGNNGTSNRRNYDGFRDWYNHRAHMALWYSMVSGVEASTMNDCVVWTALGFIAGVLACLIIVAIDFERNLPDE